MKIKIINKKTELKKMVSNQENKKAFKIKSKTMMFNLKLS